MTLTMNLSTEFRNYTGYRTSSMTKRIVLSYKAYSSSKEAPPSSRHFFDRQQTNF